MLKIEITLSWNDFPFLAGCLAHQTSVIDHLRLLRLEQPSANLCIGLLRDIHGPNFSWPFHTPCPSEICFPWFPWTDCNKRGDCSKPLGAGGALGHKSVTSACPPPCSAAVHGTPRYREQLRFGVRSCPGGAGILSLPLHMWLWGSWVTPGAAWEMAKCSSDIRVTALKKILWNPRETLTGFGCFV